MNTKTTFLLVEDDKNDVFFVERQLDNVPHAEVQHVWDGREAMWYLLGEGDYADREEYPMPDVVLLDLKMAGVSGFDFLEWLRAEAPEELRVIPIVVLSSSALQEDVKRAYALGANSYLTKPVDWDMFKERIKQLGIFWAEHAETPDSKSKPSAAS
jgi:CheY-like chemotaxis protein